MNFIILKFLSIILLITTIRCEDAKTNQTETATTVVTVPQAATTPTATIATEAPKINVKDSALCKKCSCKFEPKASVLNCNTTAWFTDDDWRILQNGDIAFETIILEHNNLTEVPVLKAISVKNLSLAFNQIKTIEAGAFQFLGELEILNLSHNNLTSKSLSPDVFRGNYSEKSYQPLAKMRELNLGYNDLHTLDSDLFEHFPHLETLNLAGNIFHIIDHLSETAIAGISTLKTLDLSDMELSELPPNLLHSPRDLHTLILSENLFKTIPKGLKLAVNLETLILDNNPIRIFGGANVFPPMEKLQYLSISYLPDLIKIDKGSLSNLQNLKTLIASNNPSLIIIDPGALMKPTVNKEIFDYPILEKLHLHNNNLSTLNSSLLVRWDKIKSIDLRFNKWQCDCTNSWLIHTLMAQINTTTPALINGVECATPEQWKSVSLIDLSTEKQQLRCIEGSHPEPDSKFLVRFFIGMFLGIPATLGIAFLYRRYINRRNLANSLYNRASYSDDFHI